MLGAIFGDIAGSVYERHNIKTKDFQPLLSPHGRFTDDTVLTVAVADALVNDRDIVTCLKEWGRRYPRSGYGGRFSRWLFTEQNQPYGSYGNGGAMRISAAGFMGRDLKHAVELAQQVTQVTHDHPEGINGATATAAAIHLAKQGQSAPAIRTYIAETWSYDLSPSVDEIRPSYTFDVSSQGSVPQALICALEATSFEDAIRNAISIGGDSDTIAAIAGSLAEARFGIPEDLAILAWARLPGDMRHIIELFYARIA
ncbi:MAG: ADP-ribosylglycohydrolase family protein [Betaproteobacteria bacterium]|nr:ADP-ribosylglycohydrolase family protein [Betaproteobacteria bacterium]